MVVTTSSCSIQKVNVGEMFMLSFLKVQNQASEQESYSMVLYFKLLYGIHISFFLKTIMKKYFIYNLKNRFIIPFSRKVFCFPSTEGRE